MMDLVRWRHRRPSPRADSLASLIDSFFEPAVDRLPDVFRAGGFPVVNLSEDENAFVVSAELPGLDEKDIELEVMSNQLLISGERKFEEEKKEKEFHRVESQYGSFSRSIALPSGLRTDRAEASYQKGILTVKFPKVEPTPSTKIKVKGS